MSFVGHCIPEFRDSSSCKVDVHQEGFHENQTTINKVASNPQFQWTAGKKHEFHDMMTSNGYLSIMCLCPAAAELPCSATTAKRWRRGSDQHAGKTPLLRPSRHFFAQDP